MGTEDDGEEHQSFGEWAKEVRLRKGLDVRTVAYQAGISGPALYKIENGDIKNPRSQTKQSLISALGEKYPSSEEIVQEPKPSVPGIGVLEDFDPYELDTIPDSSGVYVFYDISKRPIYVGRSKNLRNRIKTHSDRFWFKSPIVETGSFVEIKDEKLRNQVEKVLISFLKNNAVVNQKLVDRDAEE